MVKVYTDGACRAEIGGWGFRLEYHQAGVLTAIMECCGGERSTTNQRMEIEAARYALVALRHPCEVLVVTDSRYLQRGMTEWVWGWLRNGWQSSQKKPVANREIWERLLAAAKPHVVDWTWIKGHSGDVGNTRADALAVKGLQAAPADESERTWSSVEFRWTLADRDNEQMSEEQTDDGTETPRRDRTGVGARPQDPNRPEVHHVGRGGLRGA